MASDASVIFTTALDSNGLKAGLTKLKSSIGTFAKGASIAIGVAATGLGALAKLSVSTGMGFDSVISKVQATMNATTEETALLRSAAQQMGETTKFTAAQAGEAENYLALAGKNAKQSIAALPGVLNLAAAGGMDLAYATDLATDAMAALGLQDGQLVGFSDQMARTAQKSNTTVSMLGEAILTIGGTAKQLHDGTAELNTDLGILANRGIKGAQGGTILRNVILSLSAPTKQARRELKNLGVDIYDTNGNLRSTNDIFTDLNASMVKMSDAEKNNALSTIFNKRDLKGVQALLGGMGAEYDALYQQIVNSAGASAEMSATMLDNLKGDATIFKSAAEGLGIAFYDGFSSQARGTVQYGTTLIGQLTDAMKTNGVSGMVSALGNILGDVASKASVFTPKLIKMSVGLIKSLLNGLKKNSKVIAKGLAETFSEAVKGLIEIAPDLTDVGLELLFELTDSLAEEMPDILVSLMDSVFNIIIKTVTNAPKLLAAGAKLAQGLVLGMMSALVTLVADFWNLLLGDADEKMNAAMAAVDANIRPEISEADQQAITDAINAGIAAADKVFDIQASVDTDIDDFTAELDAMFADDKFTKKELKNLQSTLNGQVDDAINAATAHVEEKREEYKQTLLSLVDDNGQPVYTEAAAETLAAAMSEKTAELTSELDQARTDLNTLLNTIYASKTDPTQEQLDNINALLEQIGVLEVKLGTLQDQAVQVAMAKTGRVKRGEGTDEDFGVAIGFTGELYRQQTAEIAADADARLAALQAVADADGVTQETIDAAYAQMDTVYGETALTHQAAAQSYNDEMLALYNGMAEQYPDAARTISNLADLSGTMNEVNTLTTTLGSMDAFDPTQLSTFMEQFTAMYTDFYGMDIPAGDMERLLDPFTFATTASELLSTFNDDIAGLIKSNAAGLDDNPMMLYLQTMLENGSFDNLDVTAVDGALEDALLLIDFVARGEEAGTQLVDGVNGGIGKAAEDLSEDDIIALREAMLEAMRSVFGIHSPATSMYPIGGYLVGGIVAGMEKHTPILEGFGATVVLMIVAGVTRMRNRLQATVRTVVSGAAAAATGIAMASGHTLGATLGAGVAAGILSQIGTVRAAVASLVAAGEAGGRKAAEAHSPSRRYRRMLGIPLGQGVSAGILSTIETDIIPSMQTAVTAAAQAGQNAMHGTLLGRVQAISGFDIPNFAGISNALLRGSLLTGGSSVVNNRNKTIQFTQNVTFESTMQAPDEVAKTLRRQAGYGLAGAKV